MAGVGIVKAAVQLDRTMKLKDPMLLRRTRCLVVTLTLALTSTLMGATIALAGDIPLGNLFDDGKKMSLVNAIATDEFGAYADNSDLGVWTTISGFENPVIVAPGVTFDFQNVGGSKINHSRATNDAIETGDQSRGVRTTGTFEPAIAQGRKFEDGIGLHANNLVTFDLADIRRAGSLADDQSFQLIVERMGLNDSALQAVWPNGSVRIVVLIINANAANPTVQGSVNGVVTPVSQIDGRWQVQKADLDELKADGKYASLDVSVPGTATHVVIACTGGNGGISSDHAVLSGARLVYRAP